MSVDAPERIWVNEPSNHCVVGFDEPNLDYNIEYVRAYKLEELAAENERLKRQLELTQDTDSKMKLLLEQEDQIIQHEAALAEKDKEIAALRKALEPFALEYEERSRLAPGPDIDHWPIGGSALTYRHIRIAYEASRNAGGNDA